MRLTRLLHAAGALTLAATLMTSVTAAPASADGPPLTVPTAQLDAAVSCSDRVSPTNARRTVLLIHGTASTPEEAWGWGFQRQLDHDGFGVCTVRLPDRALADFALSAQYAVHAARVAYARSGHRRIGIAGHSQGGAMAVWISKFWPDVAHHASDVVSIAGPLQGTTVANGLCIAGACAPLAWQLRHGSNTTNALVRAPAPAGLPITSIATRLDELITPQPRASTMAGARTILVQDVCPARVVEHGLLLGDPVAYGLLVDAMTHDGPASAPRIDGAVCRQLLLSEADPVGALGFASTVQHFLTGLANPLTWVTREPAVPAYAR